MIRTPHHTDPLVLLQPVDLIQKVASGARRHEAVDVFENQETRCGFARFLEDLADAVFGIEFAERFNVEADDGGGKFAEGFHQGFDGDCFAVTGRAMEDQAALEKRISRGAMWESSDLFYMVWHRKGLVFAEWFFSDEPLPSLLSERAMRDREIVKNELIETPSTCRNFWRLMTYEIDQVVESSCTNSEMLGRLKIRKAGAHLPRNRILPVGFPILKKPLNIIPQSLLHLFIKDHIIPISLLHTTPKLRTLLPRQLIKDPDLIMQLQRPLRSLQNQSINEQSRGLLLSTLASLAQNKRVILHPIFPIRKPFTEIDEKLHVLPTIAHLREDNLGRQGPLGAIDFRHGRQVGAQDQTCGLLIWFEDSLARFCEAEEVALRGLDDGQVVVRMALAEAVTERHEGRDA